MSRVEVVRAQESDVPLILELIEGLAEYERLRHVCRATEDKLRASLFCERPAAEVLIALVDGEAVGFALFFSNYSTFLAQSGIFLEDLFVKPHARGQGAGIALLRAIAQLAVERGCGRIDWSVLDWNEPSIRFYRKLGAEPLEEWTTFRLTGEALRSLSEIKPA